MIVDDIENLAKYKIIPQKVVDFLTGLTSDTESGHFEIDETSYANVDIYNTKSVDACKFEAHKKYIDIQMLLKGSEELDIINVNELKVSEEYDEKRDVMFFNSSQKSSDMLFLTPGKFVLIYPHEAHRPQMGDGSSVKKVVVKILF